MQSSKKPYILFVDDEDMTRKMFERIAGKEFDLLTADSVPEAQKLLDVHADNIGVLLTDQRMPGHLGVELLEYCRAQYPTIVRMLTTAYSDLADAIDAVNRGEIIRYIEKPWTNIDALLIDLRVAMRFHLLERENKLLLDEKLSAGAAISRLDRVRSIIDIGAAQSNYSRRLEAVEKMLRDLADLDCVQNPLKARVLGEMEMFGQPVSDTLAAIGVADGITQLDSASIKGKWEDILSVCRSAGAECEIQSSDEPSEELSKQISKMVLGVCAALAYELNLLKVKVSGKHEEWQIDFSHSGNGDKVVSDWISGVHLDEANLAVSGLMLAYLVSTEYGFSIRPTIRENALEGISLTGIGGTQDNEKLNVQATADWIDDILLLYS